MKNLFLIAILLLFGSGSFAYSLDKIETKEDAWNRQSAENYNVYKNNNYNAPLGGYNRTLGDNGGRDYGNSQPYSNSLNSNRSRNYQQNNWNRINNY